MVLEETDINKIMDELKLNQPSISLSARLWFEFAEITFKYDEQINEILPVLKSSKAKKLLFLGCGCGSHDRRFAKLGYDCTGVDCDYDKIELARLLNSDNNLSIEYIYSPCEAYFSSKIFDAVLWLNVPLSLDELLYKFILCAKRNLVPNGIIVFDYLTPIKSLPGLNEISVLEDQILFKGINIKRTVTIDRTHMPWTIQWEMFHKHEKIFSTRPTALPQLAPEEVQVHLSNLGWQKEGVIRQGIIKPQENFGIGFSLEVYRLIE